MGYCATGSFSVSFEDAARRDAAFEALVASGHFHKWGSNSMFTDFEDVVANVWESYGNGEELSFGGWVSDKWHEEHEQFARTVAPFAKDLCGSFRGEDDSAWAWSLDAKTREFVEESIEDVPFTQFVRMNADRDAIDAAVAALVAGDEAAVLRAVKVRAVALVDDPAVLARLAEDADLVVCEAASARVLEAAGKAR